MECLCPKISSMRTNQGQVAVLALLLVNRPWIFAILRQWKSTTSANFCIVFINFMKKINTIKFYTSLFKPAPTLYFSSTVLNAQRSKRKRNSKGFKRFTKSDFRTDK